MNPHEFAPLEGSIGPVCSVCYEAESTSAHHPEEQLDEDAAFPAPTYDRDPREPDFRESLWGGSMDSDDRLNIVDQAAEFASIMPDCQERTELIAAAAKYLTATIRDHTYPAYVVKPENPTQGQPGEDIGLAAQEPAAGEGQAAVEPPLQPYVDPAKDLILPTKITRGLNIGPKAAPADEEGG